MRHRCFSCFVLLSLWACDANPPGGDEASLQPAVQGAGEFSASIDRSLDGLDACMAGCSIDHEFCVVDALGGCDLYSEQSPLPLVEDSCTYQLGECRSGRDGCEADCFDIFAVGSSSGGGEEGDTSGDDDGGSATADPPNPCSQCPAGQSCHCEPFVCMPNGVACP